MCPVWCEKCFIPKIAITRLDYECHPCREATVRSLEAPKDPTAHKDNPNKDDATTFEATLHNMMEVDMSSWGARDHRGG